MATRNVSPLMLERFRLGEVTSKEREFVETELSLDTKLRSRLASLEASDKELRQCYPFDSLPGFRGNTRHHQNANIAPFSGRKRLNRLVYGLAAAALLCVLFPSLFFLRMRSANKEGYGTTETGPDRIKGTGVKPELAIYLKETLPAHSFDEGKKLSDMALLKEGNTVQLAYTAPPGMCYGVIFSIDGRSALTMHYPYRKGQSSTLVAGKRTFLNEAYTLDDAPKFEVFFMVASPDPLDIEKVLQIAGELAREPETALAKSAGAFSGYAVESITVRKK